MPTLPTHHAPSSLAQFPSANTTCHSSSIAHTSPSSDISLHAPLPRQHPRPKRIPRALNADENISPHIASARIWFSSLAVSSWKFLSPGAPARKAQASTMKYWPCQCFRDFPENSPRYTYDQENSARNGFQILLYTTTITSKELTPLSTWWSRRSCMISQNVIIFSRQEMFSQQEEIFFLRTWAEDIVSHVRRKKI